MNVNGGLRWECMSTNHHRGAAPLKFVPLGCSSQRQVSIQVITTMVMRTIISGAPLMLRCPVAQWPGEKKNRHPFCFGWLRLKGALPQTEVEKRWLQPGIFLANLLPRLCLTHLLSGWPKNSSNFIFTTKMVFPKSLKIMNSGSELITKGPEHWILWNI